MDEVTWVGLFDAIGELRRVSKATTTERDRMRVALQKIAQANDAGARSLAREALGWQEEEPF